MLKDALRRPGLVAEEIDQAGRFIQKYLRSSRGEIVPLKVLLLGQCTTSWLATAVTAVAWGHQIPILVEEGGYDTVLQDLSRLTASSAAPDVLVLLPWHQRLLRSDDTNSQRRIEDELEYWHQAWDCVNAWPSTRLLQIGYDWVTPGACGVHFGGLPGGAVSLVREVNDRLRKRLPSGSYFLDLEQVAGWIGRTAFYDPRRYFWTKQPLSEQGVCWLAEHLVAAIRALTTGPKKVLVVDLDNTLWGGVVGEARPSRNRLGRRARRRSLCSVPTSLEGSHSSRCPSRGGIEK